ncbi:hypothetical protein WBG78_23045 [Chryseolinea sp. T2]|uniref:DUF6985 domain-containing protein n=1 Tax=Chryseolinea sp. T2 TaxID=3129255 RepID=UPI0030785496
MNKSEILEHLVRTGPNDFELEVYSKFFASNIKVLIFSGDSDDDRIVISDYLVDCVNDVIGYNKEERDQIVTDIFADYEIVIKASDYGVVPDELLRKHKGNSERANREYFGIHSAEEAYQALTFKYASVVEYSQGSKESAKPRYFGLFFRRPWDAEHELQLEFEDGKYKKLH